MSKIELSPLPSGFATTAALNARLDQIEEEFNDKVLYRSNPEGEPNAMENILDMADHHIINLLDATEDHHALPYGQFSDEVAQEVNDQLAEQMLLVGTGNVVGPLSSLNDQVALFDGVTGKLIKVGQTIAQYLATFLVTLRSLFINRVENVATLAATAVSVGQRWVTDGRITANDGGGSEYIVVTIAEYNTLVGNTSGITALGNGGDGTVACFDFLFSNGLIGYKEKRKEVFTEELCDISLPSAIPSAFIAAAHAGARLIHNADVTTDFIVIDGAETVYIDGRGSLTLSDEQDKSILDILHATNRVDVLGIRLNGNASNQAPVDRNDGANLRIVESACPYSIKYVKSTNNYSGASILLVDNAAVATEQEYTREIAYCTITNCGLVGGPILSDGIFSNSDNTNIHDNVVTDVSDYYIAVDYSYNVKIVNNTCRGGLVGFGILGVTKAIVQNNTLDGCNLGIAVTLSGNPATAPYLSYDVDISGNSIRNVIAAGGLSGDAIFVDPSATAVNVYDNKVDVAERGIVGLCPNMQIHNNIVNTTVDAAMFCDGEGSVIIGNITLNAGAANNYGDWTDKVVIEGNLTPIVDIAVFTGSWSNFGGSYRVAGYRTIYNVTKTVQLFGAIKGGTVVLGQPVFTLPVGSRPVNPARFVLADGTGLAVFEIATNGAVIFVSTTGTGSEVHLDSVQFEAV